MTDKSIEQVKEAWEDRLMAIPGVTGVSIGLTKDRQGPCIKVYVNRKAFVQVTTIPQEIEGFPVEIVRRGIFRAL